MIQFLLKKVSAFATKHSPKSHVILLDFPAWMLGKRTKIILPNGGFDGDESHGTLVLKESPTKNKSKVMIQTINGSEIRRSSNHLGCFPKTHRKSWDSRYQISTWLHFLPPAEPLVAAVVVVVVLVVVVASSFFRAFLPPWRNPQGASKLRGWRVTCF